MANECARSEGTSYQQGMSLNCIWRVEQDMDYQVTALRNTENGLVAIRTLGGEGGVDEADFGHHILPAGSLLITEIARLRNYGTVKPRWIFLWFEFARESGVNFPWHEVLTVAPLAWEAQMTAQMFALLARPDYPARAAASARFSALLYDWAVRWQRPRELPNPHQEMVYAAIQRMQLNLAQPLRLEDLAGEFGVSARWFRQVFTSIIGIAPQQYYTELRLRQTAHALSMGMGTVTQLAEQFGYSSPFHLSSAFKRKFGCSPSRYVKE